MFELPKVNGLKIEICENTWSEEEHQKGRKDPGFLGSWMDILRSFFEGSWDFIIPEKLAKSSEPAEAEYHKNGKLFRKQANVEKFIASSSFLQIAEKI